MIYLNHKIIKLHLLDHFLKEYVKIQNNYNNIYNGNQQEN